MEEIGSIQSRSLKRKKKNEIANEVVLVKTRSNSTNKNKCVIRPSTLIKSTKPSNCNNYKNKNENASEELSFKFFKSSNALGEKRTLIKNPATSISTKVLLNQGNKINTIDSNKNGNGSFIGRRTRAAISKKLSSSSKSPVSEVKALAKILKKDEKERIMQPKPLSSASRNTRNVKNNSKENLSRKHEGKENVQKSPVNMQSSEKRTEIKNLPNRRLAAQGGIVNSSTMRKRRVLQCPSSSGDDEVFIDKKSIKQPAKRTKKEDALPPSPNEIENNADGEINMTEKSKQNSKIYKTTTRSKNSSGEPKITCKKSAPKIELDSKKSAKSFISHKDDFVDQTKTGKIEVFKKLSEKGDSSNRISVHNNLKADAIIQMLQQEDEDDDAYRYVMSRNIKHPFSQNLNNGQNIHTSNFNNFVVKANDDYTKGRA